MGNHQGIAEVDSWGDKSSNELTSHVKLEILQENLQQLTSLWCLQHSRPKLSGGITVGHVLRWTVNFTELPLIPGATEADIEAEWSRNVGQKCRPKTMKRESHFKHALLIFPSQSTMPEHGRNSESVTRNNSEMILTLKAQGGENETFPFGLIK